MRPTAAGPGNTADATWRIVRAADDAKANRTQGGGFAYRNPGPTAWNTYSSNTCAETQTPPLTAGGPK